ncbi:MAG TPA: putative sulfate exporter family transporter, partial [Bryobacteraceae bacterium]
MLPGVALLFGIGLLGKLIEHVFGILRTEHHLLLPQIDYVLWAILLGLLISNTFGVSRVFHPGVATYELWLKLGIVLVGARFLLQDVLHIGGFSLVLVAVELVLSLSVMTLLGRIFRLPPKLTSLLAIGSSICGVTAIMAAQGAIEPEEEDTTTAIAAILTL